MKARGFDHCYDCRAEIYVYEKYLEIRELLQTLQPDIVLKRNAVDYVNYVTTALKANRIGIVLELIFNGFIFKGKYNFTKVSFGDHIENEQKLRDILNEGFRRFRLSGEATDLDDQMNRLNLN